MAPHSADQFGEPRDHWWNADFLDLMAKRWGLARAGSLADIGCGVGHWSLLLFPRLLPSARLVGVDREREWVTQATRSFRAVHPDVAPERGVFLQGDALALPLGDSRFDVVTCQTLLMHLAEPEKALAEMIRIAKPGGLIVCSEPNNLFNAMVFDSLTRRQPTEQIVRRFEFWLRHQRGKVARGDGDECIADVLPGMFAEAGLRDVRVCQTDKGSPIVPPYERPEERALLAQRNEEWEEGARGLQYETIRSNVLAGGATERFFVESWKQLRQQHRDERRAIRRGLFSTAGGVLHFLVSGVKP